MCNRTWSDGDSIFFLLILMFEKLRTEMVVLFLIGNKQNAFEARLKRGNEQSIQSSSKWKINNCTC